MYKYMRIQGKELAENTLHAKGIFSMCMKMVQEKIMDQEDADFMKGRKVLIVDDVISTGESLRALETLVLEAGGIIAGRMAILAEGDAQSRDDLIYLEKLPVFNRDGEIIG